MMNLFGHKPSYDPAVVDRLKRWARELLGLGEDVSLTVMQLNCAEDDCPDVETVVGVLEQGNQRKYNVMDRILNLGGFDLDRAMVTDPQFLEPEYPFEWGSVGLTIPGDLDPKKLNEWLQSLLMTQGQDIFRMKRVLAIKGDPNRFVFQGFQMLFDGQPDRPRGKQPRTNKLIFIGRNLDREQLTEGFRSCLA
jgi:G3E family GTPase